MALFISGIFDKLATGYDWLLERGLPSTSSPDELTPFERGEQTRKKILTDKRRRLEKETDYLAKLLKSPFLSVFQLSKSVEDLRLCLSTLKEENNKSAIKAQILKKTENGYLKMFDIVAVGYRLYAKKACPYFYQTQT